MASKENVQIKLWEAIEVLAKGSGRIQERIEGVFLNLVGIALPPGGDLSAADQEEIEAIIGSMQQGLNKSRCHLNDEEARDIVQRILSLYLRLCPEE